jgi:chromosomal replication initiation ATPase DnaA
MVDSYQDEIQRILDANGMTWEQVIGNGMSKPFIKARAEVYMMLRNRPRPWSYPRIAELCGGRHHTTVMQTVERYEAMLNGEVKSSRRQSPSSQPSMSI